MNSRLGHLCRDSGLILFKGLGITEADVLVLLLLEPGLQDFPSVKRDLYLTYSRADGIDQICSLIEASDALQFIWLHGGAVSESPHWSINSNPLKTPLSKALSMPLQDRTPSIIPRQQPPSMMPQGIQFSALDMAFYLRISCCFLLHPLPIIPPK
jgi:hypothetical protein